MANNTLTLSNPADESNRNKSQDEKMEKKHLPELILTHYFKNIFHIGRSNSLFFE